MLRGLLDSTGMCLRLFEGVGVFLFLSVLIVRVRFPSLGREAGLGILWDGDSPF